MAAILNDKDNLLQASAIRLSASSLNYLSAVYSSTTFGVVNGVPATPNITIQAVVNGIIYGIPTFTIISGISAVDTSVPGQVTLNYNNLTSDKAVVQASLICLGQTYTLTCSVEGKILPPAQVGAATVTVDGTRLNFRWPANTESDLAGYEIRTTNTGWGTAGFIYKGNTTSTNVSLQSTTIGNTNTWYIRAYDSSGLYSATSRTITYTVAVPTTPTGITHSFAVTSATNSLCTISWTTIIPVFGLKEYKFYSSVSGVPRTTVSLATNILSIETDWQGTLSVEVAVVDLLGNESAKSTVYSIVKTLPNAPTGQVLAPYGNQLQLKWTDAVKTSLPVLGYEIRKNNTDWGTLDSNFVWRGNATEFLLSAPPLGVNSYYINTYDSDKRYAASPVQASYTVVRPNIPTGLTSSFTDTSTTNATVTVSWVTPATTSFIPDKYRISFIKPGVPEITTNITANSWTTAADWVGSESTAASFKIWTIDALGNESSTFTSLSLSKLAPNAPGTINEKVIGAGVQLFWNPPTKTTLPIHSYEVRTNIDGWGTTDSALLWRGSATSFTVTNLSIVDTNNYYIKTIDTDGVYSTAYASKQVLVTAPAAVTGANFTYTNSNTGTTVTVFWTPSVSKFDIAYYIVTINDGQTTKTIRALTTEVTVDAAWATSATFTITPYNILGQAGADTQVVVPKQKPAQVGTVTVTYTPSGVELSWGQITKTSLPISGYEIRSTDTGWGTSGFVWRGQTNSAVITSGLTAGTRTWFIKALDTATDYSGTSRSFVITITAPGTPTISAPVYADTNSTAATVTFTWAAVKNTFDVANYQIELDPATGSSVFYTSNSTSWTTLASWAGDATLKVTAVDTFGISSAQGSLSISKLPPPSVTPGTITTTPAGKFLRVKWGAVTKTTLPIAGYEIRTTNSDFGTAGFVYRGTDTTADINTLAIGVNTWYIAAYDTDGKYSNASTINYTLANPGQATNIQFSYADTSVTAATVRFTWTPPTAVFDITEYQITLTKPSLSTIVTTVTGTDWTTLADWVGTASISITTKDVLGNSSTASTNNSIIKTAPQPATSPIITVGYSNIKISWTAAVKGSLPVSGYELRTVGTTPGNPGAIWKGTALSTEVSALVEGTNSWDLWTFDTDGRYSATRLLINYTVEKPSTPTINTTAFSTTLTSALAYFSWTESSDPFGIDYYEVSLVTTNPARTITQKTKSNYWELPADWLGTATLNVTARNVLGVPSDLAELGTTKNEPPQPGTISTKIVGTSLVLDWPDATKTTLPVLGYEVRSADSNWGSAGFVWKGSASQTSVDLKGLAVGTSVTYFIRAYDTDNRYSASSRATTAYIIAAPVNTTNLTYTFKDTSLTNASILLSWAPVNPIFGLKDYEVTGSITVTNGVTTTAASPLVTLTSTKGLKIGDVVRNCPGIPNGRTITSINPNGTQVTLNSGTGVTAQTLVSATFDNITYVGSTSVAQSADWLGDKTFTVRIRDLLGNSSTGISVSTTKALPGTATNFRAQVIDNTVLLYWDLPAITTLPISHVTIRKGSTWATAASIGDKDGTFTTITELQAGEFTYWIAVVDTDNNFGNPISLVTRVSQPPDYIFNAEWTSTFTGTRSNAIIDLDGSLVLPVNTTETFEQHFTVPAWAGPSAQVAAGYPIYIQPGTTSGYYEEIFDYGAVLGASQITTSINGIVVSGNPTISVELSTGTSPGVYTATYASGSAFLTNFRYIKLRVTVTQNIAGAIYKIQALKLRLDAKQKTDSGTAILVDGGAHVQANISPDYYKLWIPGSYPSGYALNGTTVENQIVLSNGPSGQLEPLWACIDSDIASDGDGGWISSYFSADLTKSHLFAVFVKTTTNNGSTYWGLDQDNTIATLAGTTTNNPYFWSGDLPGLDTWYLIVGYVYPIGYGTTDHGITGVYDLSGTKLLSGTSYKNVSGSTLMHRSYHYYNSTGTGSPVQYMARPIVLEADYTNAVANANQLISYILQCATKPGIAVTPNAEFIDVVAINTTLQSATSYTTTVVDFYDKPYPDRFNIFNYNSSGILQPGTVSWSVRGY